MVSNLEMRRQLASGEAIDVRRVGREITEGVFQLPQWVEGKDYCDAYKERWIGSIGRHLVDGRVMASQDARYYGDPNWECLFLR